jgi:hypothetical protein
MDTLQTAATATAVIVLILAFTSVIIVRIAIRDTASADRARILSSAAGLIRAILGMK